MQMHTTLYLILCHQIYVKNTSKVNKKERKTQKIVKRLISKAQSFNKLYYFLDVKQIRDQII